MRVFPFDCQLARRQVLPTGVITALVGSGDRRPRAHQCRSTSCQERSEVDARGSTMNGEIGWKAIGSAADTGPSRRQRSGSVWMYSKRTTALAAMDRERMIEVSAMEAKLVYLFRSEQIVSGSGTVVCAASSDLVVDAYGGGGHLDQDGLRQAFGGSAFYRNDETGEVFQAVWGARNASRFRSALRRRASIQIIREPPPARLAWWGTVSLRPPPSAQREMA